jgi:hypothetical protein
MNQAFCLSLPGLHLEGLDIGEQGLSGGGITCTLSLFTFQGSASFEAVDVTRTLYSSIPMPS